MSKTDHRATSRILDILEMLSSSDEGYTLTEIAKQINAPKSSIFPIIHTLEDRHYITLQQHSGKYRIGISAFAVGSTYFNSKSVLNHISAMMNDLVGICNETCSMGVLNGSNVLYVAKIDSPQSLRLVTHVGKKLPANCTALGKALLSKTSYDDMKELFEPEMLSCTKYSITDFETFYSQVKEIENNGYAIENQEFAEQIICIAVPIVKDGKVLFAISVSVPAFRFDEKKEKLVKTELKNLKLRIELLIRNYSRDIFI